MLGQLQLATYAAVLLGFTGATTTGLLLSERNQKRLGRDRIAGSGGRPDTRVVIQRQGRSRHDASNAQTPLEPADSSLAGTTQRHLDHTL